MRVSLLAVITLFFLPQAMANQDLSLGNDSWPPFIIEGEEQGISEKLVCEALSRAGWTCHVAVKEWEQVLTEAKEGSVDGIAAAWKTPEREQYLLFSDPYMTNRIVPVVAMDGAIHVKTAGDLAGLKVAMVPDYAYGSEIEDALASFTQVPAKGSAAALKAVQDGTADLALVDELVVRTALEGDSYAGILALDAVLAYRELFFAVSRQHPQAEQIIADFHRTFELMLKDGAVNEALGVDWLATDLGNDGKMDLVLSKGISLDDLKDPAAKGSTYALEQSDYRMMKKSDLDLSNMNYQVDGKSHSSLQSALVDVFGKDVVCEHREYTSTLDCSKIFEKR